MSRTISLIAALGASLVLAAPAAFGQGQPAVDVDPATEALMLRSEALGRAYQNNPKLFLGRQIDPATEAVILRGEALGKAYQSDPTLLGGQGRDTNGFSPDAFERAVASQSDTGSGERYLDAYQRLPSAGGQVSIASMPDALERAVAAHIVGTDEPYRDAHERIPDAGGKVTSGPAPDAFERAVGALDTGSLDHFLANDNRFQVKPVDEPTQVTVSSSGDEIEWPQIGIGLGIGMLLMLGLVLALRATRHPPLAH
jgi:hypothetical protein